MIINYDKFLPYYPKVQPVRHRRKVPFAPSIPIGLETREVIKRIHQLDHELDRFILTADDYLDLVTEAYASNIHWSTKIEGNPLSEGEVLRLTRDTVAGGTGEETPGPQQEIINHLYSYFFQDRLRLPWSMQTISTVHHMLTEGTGTAGVPGKFRDIRVSILDRDEEAFVPCPPEHVKEETRSLLDWLNAHGQAFEALICSTVMFHEFESIHPFEDGNGRVGRTLFHLLLQDMGLSNVKLCKIDLKLLRNPSIYYSLLAYTDENDSYPELIDYFAFCVLEAYEDAAIEFGRKDLVSKGLDEATLRLVQKARDQKGWFAIKDATGWVEGIGEQSVRKRLNQLVDMRLLAKEGRTLSTRFKFLDPFEPFKTIASGERYQRIKLA